METIEEDYAFDLLITWIILLKYIDSIYLLIIYLTVHLNYCIFSSNSFIKIEIFLNIFAMLYYM